MGSDSVRLRHYSLLGIVNVTCPLDINRCPFVHWTNRNVHWTFKCPLDIQMSIRPVDEQKCPLDIQHSNVHSSSGPTEMSIGHKYRSIRPLDKQIRPLDIQTSIRPVDEQKCPLDIQISIRPLDEWTNGHCLIGSTLVSCPYGVRLNQITSLQLPWHCKRYMSIGHK